MGTRDLNTVVSNALDDDVVNPYFAIEMLFDTSPLRLWNGVGEKTFNGDTYTGAGDLLSISQVEETTELAARGITINLSGIPSNIVSVGLSEPYQGRVCNVYMGVEVGGTFSDPVEIFSGFMNEMNFEEGADTINAELTVENKLIDLERKRVRRYTSGYQKSIHPTDKGLDFIESFLNKSISWGKKVKEPTVADSSSGLDTFNFGGR